jgi:hypothetical protein
MQLKRECDLENSTFRFAIFHLTFFPFRMGMLLRSDRQKLRGIFAAKLFLQRFESLDRWRTLRREEPSQHLSEADLS